MVAFIISSSYVESTILVLLEYLTKLHITSFILMAENHTDKELLLKNHTNISLCDSIESGILACDIIIVVNCKFLPNSTLTEVELKSEFYNKRLLVLNTIFNNECEVSWNTSRERPNGGIPNICLVSIGSFTQIEQTEIFVHKILGQNNITVQFQMSPATEHILKQMPRTTDRSRTESIYNQLGVSVVTFLYNDILELLNDYMLVQNIHDLQPDCIIVNVESTFNDFDKMNNVFLYRFNKKIDLFVISNYSSTNSISVIRRPIYHVFYPNIRNSILNNVSDFEDQIKAKILPKIMLPDDVNVINI